jgi:ferredoxin
VGPITKVSIEAGCISCKLCSDIAPDVFRVEDGQDCVVLPDAARWFRSKHDDVEQAARDCPVEVIKIERGAVASSA